MSDIPPKSPYAVIPDQPTPKQGLSLGAVLLIVFGVLFLVMVLCGGVGVAILLPAVQSARNAARNVASQNNLKQIGMAIMNYETDNRLLPPAYVVDENSNPLYSWRVLLLPYLGEEQLYSEFHLDEPWDSPHNKSLLNRVPYVYRSPNDADITSTNTSYVVPVDPKAAIRYPAIPFHMVVDGFSSTIFCVEVANSTTPWTAPDTMTTDQIIQANAGQSKPVLLGDGASVPLDFDDAANVRAGVTINGRDDFQAE